MTKQSYKDRTVARFLADGGGIFSKPTMQKLLGNGKLSGKGKTKDNFWYDRRRSVKAALIDLEVFIHVADQNNLDQTINEETLTPIVTALLSYRLPSSSALLENVGPDHEKAKIAQLFIQYGFSYLAMKRDHVTLSHKRTIEEAIDLSRYLLDSFRPESERGRIRGLTRARAD